MAAAGRRADTLRRTLRSPMRLASALPFVLAVALAACGTPPVDSGRRAPRPTPPRVATPPAPPPRPQVVSAPPRPTPPPPPAPEPPPSAPRGSITLRSVYPEANLTEWELANGGHVLFERVEGQPLRLLAVAVGGTAGLDPSTAEAARATVYARSTDEHGRFELGDVSRRIVAYGPLRTLGIFLRGQVGLGSVDLDRLADGALFDPRSAATALPPEAALEASPLPTPALDDRLFLEAVGRPGDYVVAVVGDAEIEAVEGFVAGAFGEGGRAPLAFGEAEPHVPTAPEAVDAGTGEAVSTLVYRGRLRRGDSQADVELAAFAAGEALRAAGQPASTWGRADALSGTYEVAVAVPTADPAVAAAVAARLATLAPPDDLARLRAARAEASRGFGVRMPDRGATQHLVNWHAQDGSPLRYESYDRALSGVSRSALAETMARVFGAGAYRAVLGLDLTL